MTVTIDRERPDAPDARALVDELQAHLGAQYPPESQHGYSVDKLIKEGVAFFVVRCEGVAAGCGGVQIVGAEYGELKRMYVRPAFRGRGLAKQMVDHLAAHALTEGIQLLRLETGIHQRDAIGLYERMGFYRIGPFGPYTDDPLSLYFEKQLCS